MAECWCLREGLRLVKGLNLDKVIIEMDSEKLFELLRKEDDAEAFRSTLVRDCKALVTSLGQYKLSHTFQEGNKCADWLANWGQNSNWGTTFLGEPLDDLAVLLREDAGGPGVSRTGSGSCSTKKKLNEIIKAVNNHRKVECQIKI